MEEFAIVLLGGGSVGCSDGEDNDGDGKRDYPDDAGCASSKDRSEDELVSCAEGEDANWNGKVDTGEKNPNIKVDDSSAPPAPVCGNGIKDRSEEECDDGNADNADQCSTQCRVTFCGDGVVQKPNGRGVAEECDEQSAVCIECKRPSIPNL